MNKYKSLKSAMRISSCVNCVINSLNLNMYICYYSSTKEGSVWSKQAERYKMTRKGRNSNPARNVGRKPLPPTIRSAAIVGHFSTWTGQF